MSEENEHPKPRSQWRSMVAFSAGAIGMLILVFIIATAYPPLAGWEPSQTAIKVSELVRNFGLLVAALVGFGFAYWRGKQTQDQIDLTQHQLKEAEKQFELTTQQSRRDEDRKTFREAAKLLDDKEQNQRYAGAILMRQLAEESTIAEAAIGVLLYIIGDNKKFKSINKVDVILFEFYLNIISSEDVNFRGYTFEGSFLIENKSEISFNDCVFNDAYFMVTSKEIDPERRIILTDCKVEGRIDSTARMEISRSIINVNRIIIGNVIFKECWIENLHSPSTTLELFKRWNKSQLVKCQTGSSTEFGRMIADHEIAGVTVIDDEDRVRSERRRSFYGPYRYLKGH